MFTFPLLLTIYAGFTHAFEADHLLAVTNIVSRRDHIWLSIKDGIFWGLGHTSTILLIGVMMIMFKVGISEHNFHYFEATVGLMLIALAAYRLQKFFRGKKLIIHTHGHLHSHSHSHIVDEHKHLHVHFALSKISSISNCICTRIIIRTNWHTG